MEKNYVKCFSHILNRDMEYTVFGTEGKPVIVFPTGGGRFFQFEDSGMLEVCSDFIEKKQIQVFAVDGLDWEHFEGFSKSENDRIAMYSNYVNYIAQEMVAIIRKNNKYKGKYMTVGMSLGGLHAVNLMFKFPNIFDSVISMSGIYNTARYFRSFMNDDLHSFSPLLYMNGQIFKENMEEYKKSKIIMSCGQGRWEEDAMADFTAMKTVFDNKKIPAFFDVWGVDVSHEFVWWRKQIVYFLGKMLG